MESSQLMLILGLQKESAKWTWVKFTGWIG